MREGRRGSKGRGDEGGRGRWKRRDGVKKGEGEEGGKGRDERKQV